MLNERSYLLFHFSQWLHGFGFVLCNTQHERAIAIHGDDIGVTARCTVLANQTTIENDVSDWFEIQFFRQAVTAKPARFNRFHTCCLLCTRQRFVIVAGRIADFLLQRIVGIQRFFLLHFCRNVVTGFAQRFNLCRLYVVKTRNEETNGRLNYARQLAFFFQTGIFQLIRGGGIFQPSHIAAFTGRDDIGRFFFRQRSKVTAFIQLVQYRFGFIFSFGLNDAIAVTLRLSELILMLVIVRLNISIAGRLLHSSSIQLDVAHAELFRRHKVVFILLVVAGNFLLGNRLLRGQCVNVNRRLAHDPLLCDQRRQFVRFAFQHKVRTGNAVNQLLGSKLIT